MKLIFQLITALKVGHECEDDVGGQYGVLSGAIASLSKCL